jgi:Type IV secretion-system coupling protein DNA-binding domain
MIAVSARGLGGVIATQVLATNDEQAEFDLVGFSITPAQTLTKSEQDRLNVELESLLASLAFPPPGVASLALDLRYLAVSDTSLTGKQLVVALLCRLNFAPGNEDNKAVTDSFRREFSELLSLHLEEYGYRISPVDGGAIWHYMEPFKAKDYVEIVRRVTKLRPLKMSRFQGRSPMSRAVDMLLRQQAQVCLSVYLEPHPLTEEESRELELFGYETDLLPSDDRDLRDLRALLSQENLGEGGASTPFRVAVRLTSDEPISQYLVNLLGAEISGRRDYSFQRASPEEQEDALTAISEIRFSSLAQDPALQAIPPALRNLRHLFQVTEVLAAFRLPTERIATSRERTFKTYYAPVANLPRDGLLLGFAEHPSYKQPLPTYLKTSDRRRHVYVVGKTGTGKSMLLLNTIIQDIGKGAGVCVVDPHGDLVSAVLPHIPPHRANDVVIFDPADTERVAGMNFLEATSSDTESERDFLTQEVISMILRMVDYNIEMYGPVGQQMTRMACRTLMATREPATLLEVPRLFSNAKFLTQFLRRVEDPEIKRWWEDEWLAKDNRQKHEVLGWFTSKFEPFVSAPAVRNVVGQAKSAFDFKQLMDEGKILLVNLSRGRIGALNSSALGSMVVSKLLWAATRRAWDEEESRRDFYLYVDEFQNFVSDSFDTILSEARKYRLNLVMAHQHLGQLRAMGRLGDRVERAVFGNVGTIVAFRVGTDALRIADELGTPVEASTLRSLQNRYGVAQLLVDDVPTMPFTVRTADYVAPTSAEEKSGEQIRQAARGRNKGTKEIDEEIQERWSREVPPTPTPGPPWVRGG